MSLFNNKIVLITGGTGSFGQAFVKRVLDYSSPKSLRILSRDELKQWQMSQDLKSHPQYHRLRFFLGDVRDKERLLMAFQDVDIVIHAAAMKQVPASEYNPFEVIKTNILGSINVVKASLENNVEKLIALSTDKASLPINLYGATKLCADKIFIYANNYVGKKHTRFSVVRYGNVIGSRGSVVPIFIQQAKSGILSVTHKNMTRFWMGVDEAVEFVISSLGLMQGGEQFIPKIPSMKVTNLALAIAPKTKIVYEGIRPGEKLHESLISSDEALNTYDLGDRYMIAPENNLADWNDDYNYPYKKHVPEGFSYSSNTNKDVLSVSAMQKKLKKLGFLAG